MSSYFLRRAWSSSAGVSFIASFFVGRELKSKLFTLFCPLDDDRSPSSFISGPSPAVTLLFGISLNEISLIPPLFEFEFNPKPKEALSILISLILSNTTVLDEE